MQYNGYDVGPVLRELRKDRGLTIDKVCEITELSVSSIKQIEQGGRNLSMKSLYLFMDAYQCDANTILNICMEPLLDWEDESIDGCLKLLSKEQRIYLKRTFMYMIDQAKLLAS